MSQAAVIRLRNKRSPEDISDQLQVEPSIGVVELNTYLNTILSTTAEYAFYYESTRVRDNVQEVMDRNGLGVEDVVIIDYLDMQEEGEDFSIPCEDVVTKLCFYKGSVYARLYSGDLIELGSGEKRREGTSCVAGGDRLICAEGDAVIDAETGGRVAVLPVRNIAFLESSGPIIAVGLNENKIILLKDGETEEIPTDDFYRCPRIAEDALYWIESLDVIVRYDLATKKKSNSYIRGTAVSIAVGGDVIYAATSSDAILVVRNKTIKAHAVSARVVNDIIISGSIIVLAAQHSIVSLDADTLAERACFFLGAQINSVLIAGDRLLVANGSKVSGFLLSRL